MNKKFAAVSLGLVIILGFTNCTGDSVAKAEQLNTIKNVKPVGFNLLKGKTVKNLTLLEKDHIKSIKIDKNTARMKEILDYLKTRAKKTPYVFSGSSPRWGWDCSGMVRWTYERFGITLEHSATKQAHTGKRVSYKNAKPGDIVVFSHGDNYWFYHSAIYLGNGKIINANRGYGTTIIQPLTDFKGDKIRFVRIVETN